MKTTRILNYLGLFLFLLFVSLIVIESNFPEITLRDDYFIKAFSIFKSLLFLLPILIFFRFLSNGFTNHLGCLGIIAISIVLITSLHILLILFGPIDTEETPVDVKTLKYDPFKPNRKTVIRSIRNAKTTSIRFDTVDVEDKWIFRKVVKKYN